MRFSSPRARLAVVPVAALALGLTACGSNSLGGSSSSAGAGAGSSSAAAGSSAKVTASSSLSSLVPAALKKKGTLTVGTDASYAPNEFLVGGSTIKGMDIDLVNAVLAKLGLKAKFQNAQFNTIIAGVEAGKYDMSASSFTINKQREQQVNMISYFSAGVQWAVQKGNPHKVNPAKPCGLTVGVQTGTTELSELQAMNKKQCKSNPMKLVIETLQSKVTTDLIAGKVVAMSADSPVTLYAVKQTGDKLQTVGTITETAPYGLVVPKSDTQFAKALAASLKAINKDGSYKQILDKWGQASGAVTSFVVNPTPTS